MHTNQLRRLYLDYFKELDHKIYSSAPLVPKDDASVLFTVAGMVQFKDQLLGAKTPEVPRAASCQLCLRAGGKHNDLENVGYTARHHTLFEMLGNFSFGDYFKEEAISWAWTFVKDHLKFDQDRIWITVHPTDQEARQIWEKKIGLDTSRVIDHHDNFWEMGDTGPCGPNTEIFFDQGPKISGGPPGSADEEGDRFIEFWNLVFPQFNRQPDGELKLLDAPGIDTGLGLERTAALLQGWHSNYAIDIFRELIYATAKLALISDEAQITTNPSLKVIADHIRSSAFLIAEGTTPSSDGQGYVLRRIIRRALRHGHKLGIHDPFLHQLTKPLIDVMGETYNDLISNRHTIHETLLQEEERFGSTLKQGMNILEREIDDLSGNALSGEFVFKLYDTYGFPFDVTEDIARERELSIDRQGFDQLMEEQRSRGRTASQFDPSLADKLKFDTTIDFKGYHSLSGTATVLDVYRTQDAGQESAQTLSKGESGVIVLDRTEFYGEAGGQVGDTGKISTATATFRVTDTQRMDQQFLHIGTVAHGSINKGDNVHTVVDHIRRQDIARNHTATHLLHAALKTVLGNHVLQKGSWVGPDRLRFDFSHPSPVTSNELDQIGCLVNEEIALNSKVTTELMSYDDAIQSGAVSLLGEKYDDQVRVLNVGNGFSVELCGGTHVPYTGEIGLFKITTQSSVAAGVRRIEAVTGRGAITFARQNDRSLNDIAQLLKVPVPEITSRVQVLLNENQASAQRLNKLIKASELSVGQQLAQSAVMFNGVSIVSALIEGDPKSMMSVYDEVCSRLTNRVVVLAVLSNEKINMVCGVSRDLSQKLHANDLIQYIGDQIGTRGGGNKELARSGGVASASELNSALDSVVDWVKKSFSLTEG